MVAVGTLRYSASSTTVRSRSRDSTDRSLPDRSCLLIVMVLGPVFGLCLEDLLGGHDIVEKSPQLVFLLFEVGGDP